MLLPFWLCFCSFAWKQRQRSSFNPLTSCLCLIGPGPFSQSLATCLLLLNTRENPVHAALESLPPVLVVLPAVIAAPHRPDMRSTRWAHPMGEHWQHINERKVWLSGSWWSCTLLIIPLKLHMDFLFLKRKINILRQNIQRGGLEGGHGDAVHQNNLHWTQLPLLC